MANGSVVSNSSGSQISPNIIIAIISSLFILILLYPWIIAVTLVSFVIGFTGLEHLDKFMKTSICTGRFGPTIQARYKDFLEGTESEKNVIKEVTADPLRDLIEETLDEKQILAHATEQKQNEQLQKSFQLSHGGLGNIVIQNTLIVPARLSSSNRSSPEKSKPLFDTPKRSLSAASSRRVSEDIPGSTHGLVAPFTVAGGIPGVYHQQTRNKTPSPSRSSTAASTPSPSITLNPEIVGTLRVDQEFRIDVQVDKSLGRLCTNIMNYYISPSWAPYETRRELKLCFKQLLNSVAEQCSRKLLSPQMKLEDGKTTTAGNQNAPIVKLAREKLLPLVLHYLDKILERGVDSKIKDQDQVPIIPKESMMHIVLKIRKFCKQIFGKFLKKDDQNCKLWTELCVAVLADGVLVNVMILGKDKLPELLEKLVMRFKKSSRVSTPSGESSLSSHRQTVSNVQIGSASRDENEFVDPLSENFVEARQEPTSDVEEDGLKGKALASSSSSSSPAAQFTTTDAIATTISHEKVPFLLDHFLDPPYDMDKPDPIVSRWRPTLKDIVSETDLLYPLIQYMKHVGGQQSLAYLQGVLDEFPLEGDPHCRRVLELEFLPGFCRSSLFLETMGLSRVEMAMEVGTDPFSVMRRNSSNGGHARSASYGGPSSSSSLREFLKIEGVVDGLPLTESSQQNVSISSSSSDQSPGGGSVGAVSGTSTASLTVSSEIQPSLSFKRRPYLEMFIAKFIKSTSKSWKQFYDLSSEEQHDPVKRAGIEQKSYEDWDHPEVNSRVRIESTNAEIYDSLVELVTLLMRSSPIASPFFSGLANFLKPYLMHTFNEHLDKNLTQVLSQDLLVTVVDLIADVYEESSDTDASDENNGTTHNDFESHTTRKASDEYGHFSFNASTPAASPLNASLSANTNNTNTSEEESHEYHNSSCTTCDPSFKSTVESLFTYVFESFMLTFIDLEYFVKCFSKNREFIFLFFVDLLDVLVGEIVEG